MKTSTLLTLPFSAALCFASVAHAWTPYPLIRPANTYQTLGFACYGTTFTEVDSIDALPPALLTLIKNEVNAQSFFGRGGGISDRGGPFNPSDAYVNDTPHLRFIVGALSRDVALIAVEHGGIGYNKQMWAYLRTKNGWEAAPGAYLPFGTVKGSFQTRSEALTHIPPAVSVDETPPDPHQDFARFLPLAKKGLGCDPESTHDVVKSDHDLAAVLLQAAQQGDAVAQFALAHLYANGRGVASDSAQAESWFTRAAASQAGMQYDLGYYYANGIDLPQDYTAAMRWFRMSSGAADDSLKWLSYFQLGMLYADGKGVPANKVAAYALFLSVPDYHYDPLSRKKEALEASMSKDELALAQALRQEMYLESHDKGTVTDSLDRFLANGKVAP